MVPNPPPRERRDCVGSILNRVFSNSGLANDPAFGRADTSVTRASEGSGRSIDTGDQHMQRPNESIVFEQTDITHIDGQYLAARCPIQAVLYLSPRLRFSIESDSLPRVILERFQHESFRVSVASGGSTTARLGSYDPNTVLRHHFNPDPALGPVLPRIWCRAGGRGAGEVASWDCGGVGWAEGGPRRGWWRVAETGVPGSRSRPLGCGLA